MLQILIAYGLLRETVVAIIMLYKNTKVKIRSSDGGTDFFDFIAGVLQKDTLASYLFIICQDYVLEMSIDLMKENGFTLKKARNRWYLVQTITDAGYADVIVFLANSPTQAKTPLLNLEQAAGRIGHHVNVDKTKYLSFNQKGDISTLNGGFL